MADPAASFSPALMGWPAAAYRPHTDAPTQQTFLHISRHDAAFRAEGAVQAIDSRRAGAPVVCRAVSLANSKVAFEVRLSIVGEEVQMEAKEAAEMDKMYSSCVPIHLTPPALPAHWEPPHESLPVAELAAAISADAVAERSPARCRRPPWSPHRRPTFAPCQA